MTVPYFQITRSCFAANSTMALNPAYRSPQRLALAAASRARPATVRVKPTAAWDQRPAQEPPAALGDPLLPGELPRLYPDDVEARELPELRELGESADVADLGQEDGGRTKSGTWQPLTTCGTLRLAVPRQPRLDAPDTLHRVMVRGIERTTLFRDDTDRTDVVARLAALAEQGAWSVSAWAPLPPPDWYLGAPGRLEARRRSPERDPEGASAGRHHGGGVASVAHA